MLDPAERLLSISDRAAVPLSLPVNERSHMLTRMLQAVRRRYDDSEFVTEPGIAALKGARP